MEDSITVDPTVAARLLGSSSSADVVGGSGGSGGHTMEQEINPPRHSPAVGEDKDKGEEPDIVVTAETNAGKSNKQEFTTSNDSTGTETTRNEKNCEEESNTNNKNDYHHHNHKNNKINKTRSDILQEAKNLVQYPRCYKVGAQPMGGNISTLASNNTTDATTDGVVEVPSSNHDTGGKKYSDLLQEAKDSIWYPRCLSHKVGAHAAAAGVKTITRDDDDDGKDCLVVNSTCNNNMGRNKARENSDLLQEAKDSIWYPCCRQTDAEAADAKIISETTTTDHGSIAPSADKTQNHQTGFVGLSSCGTRTSASVSGPSNTSFRESTVYDQVKQQQEEGNRKTTANTMDHYNPTTASTAPGNSSYLNQQNTMDQANPDNSNRGQQKLTKLNASTGRQAGAHSGAVTPQDGTFPDFTTSHQHSATTATGRSQVKMAKLAAATGRLPGGAYPPGDFRTTVSIHYEHILADDRDGITANETDIEAPEMRRQTEILALVETGRSTHTNIQTLGTSTDIHDVNSGELEESETLVFAGVANLVRENTVRNLPIGTLESHDIAAEEEAKKTRQQMTMRYLIGLVILGLIIVLAVVLSVVYGRRDRTDNNVDVIIGPAPSMSFSPSPAPSYARERDIHSLLPTVTLNAIETNSLSSQALAWDWLKKDLQRNRDYPDWRALQRFSLTTFFYATGGLNHWDDRFKEGWLDHEKHECNWKWRTSLLGYGDTGVTAIMNNSFASNPCDVINTLDLGVSEDEGIIQNIWLWGINLNGTLPPELGLLTSLRSINLDPKESDWWTNPNTGSVERRGGVSVWLTGTIPSQIGLVSDLEVITIQSNDFNGTVPSQVGALTSLSFIRLPYSKLTGDLPTEIGLATAIRLLDLPQLS